MTMSFLGFAQDIDIIDDTRANPVLTEDELVSIIDNQLADQSGEYSQVNVKVADEAGATRMWLYLLSATTWTMDRVTMLVADSGAVLEAVSDPTPPAMAAYVGTCPDPSIDMVFATLHTEIPTAVDGVTDACATAVAAGYTCQTVLGAAATVQAYQDWLACDLLAFGQIGHGDPTGIYLADGALDYTWFDTLASDYLDNTVMYFNSCQVHNDPLLQSMMDAGSRTYVGGIDYLYIGTSEAVFKCYWSDILITGNNMGPALTQCELDNYPEPGDHGLSGDDGPFAPVDPNSIILGFEDVSLWTANVGPLTASGTATEGSQSMSVPASGYVLIESASLSGEGDINTVTVDIMLPSPAANPWWAGQVQLLIEIPSQGIYNFWVAQTELQGLDLNTWHTIAFNVPDYVGDTLIGDSYDDLVVKFVLNVPQNAGSYLFDNAQVF